MAKSPLGVLRGGEFKSSVPDSDILSLLKRVEKNQKTILDRVEELEQQRVSLKNNRKLSNYRRAYVRVYNAFYRNKKTLGIRGALHLISAEYAREIRQYRIFVSEWGRK